MHGASNSKVLSWASHHHFLESISMQFMFSLTIWELHAVPFSPSMSAKHCNYIFGNTSVSDGFKTGRRHQQNDVLYYGHYCEHMLLYIIFVVCKVTIEFTQSVCRPSIKVVYIPRVWTRHSTLTLSWGRFVPDGCTSTEELRRVRLEWSQSAMCLFCPCSDVMRKNNLVLGPFKYITIWDLNDSQLYLCQSDTPS